MNSALTVRYQVHFKQSRKGRKRMAVGAEPEQAAALAGRVPRIARLMALAIRFQGLIERGEVKDYAELARLGNVTRARVTQLMNLLNLAPDIQEQILFLPPIVSGSDPLKEWQIRPIIRGLHWLEQQKIWRRLLAELLRPNRPSVRGVFTLEPGVQATNEPGSARANR
jgi:hypothetical protein